VYRPDAIWDMSPIGLGVFEGREVIRGAFEDWLAAYQDFDQVIEELRDLGGATFTVLAQRAQPRDSSGAVAIRFAVVGAWRNGLVDDSCSTPTSTRPAPPPTG
jgi:hypothetical protein